MEDLTADADEERSRGVVFILGTGTEGQQGPVAAWLSTAAWASAAERLWGHAWIVTPEGDFSPALARAAGAAPALRSGPSADVRHRLPLTAKTLAKDARRLRNGWRFQPGPAGPWSGHQVMFVWQRHEPFVRVGRTISAACASPLVEFVPAPVRWEAREWGVHRPGWGRLFERVAERPALRQADLVACGSQAVAEVVADLGVDADRILVTPNGVDVSEFTPPTTEERDSARRRLGLGSQFVVGWSGSFRRFHGLELAIEAVAALRSTGADAALLLVGDGPERDRLEALCEERAVPLVLTGTVSQAEIPALLAAVDVAVVTHDGRSQFHYSPLKLWEFMACGLPVVVPDLGQPAELLTDGENALIVPPGDPVALASALGSVHADHALRASLGAAARSYVVEHRTWEGQLLRIERRLSK